MALDESGLTRPGFIGRFYFNERKMTMTQEKSFNLLSFSGKRKATAMKYNSRETKSDVGVVLVNAFEDTISRQKKTIL